MADMFSISTDVGPDVPLGVVATLVRDIEATASVALDLAPFWAQSAADTYLRNLVRSQGLEGILAEAQRRELPASFGPDGELLDRLASEGYPYDFYFDEPPYWSSRSRARFLNALVDSTLGGYEPLTVLLQQFRASYAASQLADEPFRLRSLRYENPFTMEVMADGAAIIGALAFMLNVIRDWPARRRQASARARAEERIQAAAARDAEDEFRSRATVRRVMLERLVREQQEIPLDMVERLLSDNALSAIARLGERELRFTQNPDPS